MGAGLLQKLDGLGTISGAAKLTETDLDVIMKSFMTDSGEVALDFIIDPRKCVAYSDYTIYGNIRGTPGTELRSKSANIAPGAFPNGVPAFACSGGVISLPLKNLKLPNSFSWVMPARVASDWTTGTSARLRMLYLVDTVTGNYRVNLSVNDDGSLYFGGPTGAAIIPATALVPGSPFFVVGTYDSTIGRYMLYFNGIATWDDGSTGISFAPASTDTLLVCGMGSYSTSLGFKGVAGATYVFKKALSTTEIAAFTPTLKTYYGIS